MISLDDCIAFCGLSRDEIDAIAEHEHIDEINAAALAEALMSRRDGPQRIRGMMRENLRHAIAHGRRKHAREVLATLRHFTHEHPESV